MNNFADVNSDERGRQLRRDIEALYSSLKSSKSLRVGVLGNDISDFIRKYLPEGMSIEDAERTLLSAGFRIGQRPSDGVPAPFEKGYLVAAMSLPKQMFSARQVMVGLRQKAPGDYSAVGEIQASIIITYL